MYKKIITIGEDEFTLEVNRRAIMIGERDFGFRITEIDSHLFTQSYAIFCLALELHHSDLGIEERQDLFDKYNQEVGDGAGLEVVMEIVEVIGNFLNSPKQAKANKSTKK